MVYMAMTWLQDNSDTHSSLFFLATEFWSCEKIISEHLFQTTASYSICHSMAYYGISVQVSGAPGDHWRTSQLSH